MKRTTPSTTTSPPSSPRPSRQRADRAPAIGLRALPRLRDLTQAELLARAAADAPQPDHQRAPGPAGTLHTTTARALEPTR